MRPSHKHLIHRRRFTPCEPSLTRHHGLGHLAAAHPLPHPRRMSSLHLLLPPLARFDATPLLKRWLVRGDRLPDASRGREAALREVFQLSGLSLPFAALMREQAAQDAGEHAWLCADPAYVRVETNGARLLVWGEELQLTREEAESLAQPLRPLFGDAGAPLEIISSSRWALRLPQGAHLPAFVSPEAALGANLLEQLPQGDAGRRWRALFNEAQIILHSHPANAARPLSRATAIEALAAQPPPVMT